MSDIIAIELCNYHRPRQMKVARPGFDEMERERIMDALLCKACWDSDGAGLQRFMDSVGIPEDDQAVVKRNVR